LRQALLQNSARAPSISGNGTFWYAPLQVAAWCWQLTTTAITNLPQCKHSIAAKILHQKTARHRTKECAEKLHAAIYAHRRSLGRQRAILLIIEGNVASSTLNAVKNSNSDSITPHTLFCISINDNCPSAASAIAPINTCFIFAFFSATMMGGTST